MPNLALAEATQPGNDREDPTKSSMRTGSQIFASDILQGLEDSRRSTPALPPGLPIPASVASEQQRSSSPTQRSFQPITPAVPILPSTPLRNHAPPRPSEKPLDKQIERDSSATADPNNRAEGSVNETTKSRSLTHPAKDGAQKEDQRKEPVKASVRHPSSSNSTRADAAFEKSTKTEPEEVPTTGDGSKHKISEKSGHAPTALPTAKLSGPETSPKEHSNKRQPPGKLDIPSAYQTYEGSTPSQSTSTIVETPEKASHAASATSTSASRPETPGASTDSPLKKVTAPRTLRVLSTPKAETPPSASATAQAVPTGKTLSRQPSVVSINRSGTPASEIVSEPNSTTSASLSRANSPPPTGTASKFGSAPVRTKTKSQLKKERQERAKAQEQESKVVEATQILAVEEQVAAPLTGRKKKARKEKQPKAAVGKPISTTAHPPSPLREDKSEAENPDETQNEAADTATKAEILEEVVEEQTTTAMQSPQAPPKREITPASVLSDLQSAGLTLRNLLEHFKPVSNTTRHDITAADIATRDRPISLTEKDHAALVAREPLRVGGEDGRLWSRTFVTPSQKLLRGLSREEEERYMELEKRVLVDGTPTKFMPQRRGSTGMETYLPSVIDYLVDNARDVPPDPSIEERDSNADDAMMFLNQMVPPMLPTTGPADSDNAEYRPSYSASTNISGSSLPRFDFTSIRDPLSGNAGSSSTGAGASVTRQVQSPSVSVKEAESAWAESRKKTDRLERELNALIKRNRKLLTGTAH